jgi:FKBP-type peptidyl-prolyl cis-trans isomerase FkpA
MSVTQAPLQPIKRGSLLKLWAAILLLVGGAYALARLGTDRLQGETTPSGLFIRTVEQGSGERVKAVDGVYIEYEGRLADGTVFDATQGSPAPMIPAQVIPGFSEALQKMQKGGRYSVRIPGSLAYGASPPPGSPIPPNADLLFDVHVVEVVPNAALMQAGGAGVPQPQPQPQP